MDSLNSKLIVIGAIVLVLILFGIGIFVGRKTAPCAEIKVGTETTTISIVVHDTVYSKKQADSIKVIREIKQVVRTDTIHDTLGRVAIAADTISDTTPCFSFDETEKDGAYIKANVCSDSFKVKPFDLYGEIFYQAAPDTTRQVFRVDTILKLKMTPFYKDWRTYVMLVLASVIGGIYIANK